MLPKKILAGIRNTKNLTGSSGYCWNFTRSKGEIRIITRARMHHIPRQNRRPVSIEFLHDAQHGRTASVAAPHAECDYFDHDHVKSATQPTCLPDSNGTREHENMSHPCTGGIQRTRTNSTRTARTASGHIAETATSIQDHLEANVLEYIAMERDNLWTL